MPANHATAPCPPLTAAMARQIVTHAERYQHLPPPQREAKFREALTALRNHRAALAARARIQLITTHEGGAA